MVITCDAVCDVGDLDAGDSVDVVDVAESESERFRLRRRMYLWRIGIRGMFRLSTRLKLGLRLLCWIL